VLSIIAFNGLSAFGVLKELRIRGVSVPDKCAVVGIDGLKIGVFVELRPPGQASRGLPDHQFMSRAGAYLQKRPA
jgi:hypothetical protein